MIDSAVGNGLAQSQAGFSQTPGSTTLWNRPPESSDAGWYFPLLSDK